MQVESFAPIADEHARVLVLGSMPSLASLEAGEYYGHARNAFWPLMGELFGFDAGLPYAARVECLKGARVAVWDVLQSCRRAGSLDSAIESSSEVPNEIEGLLQSSPKLGAVFLNGRKAEQGWRRYFAPKLGDSLPSSTLPSTSPAMASLNFAGKLAAWSALSEQARLLP